MKEITVEYLTFVERNYPLLKHLYSLLTPTQKRRIKFEHFCNWVLTTST